MQFIIEYSLLNKVYTKNVIWQIQYSIFNKVYCIYKFSQ